jgi:glutathione S-transferase
MEITSFMEQTTRMEVDDLVKFTNDHLKMRMFMIGQSITAADILVLLNVAKYFIKDEKEKDIENYLKMQNPHVFRWLDHVQHLPGMCEQVESLGLFVSFPDLTSTEPSKAMLKKLEKLK